MGGVLGFDYQAFGEVLKLYGLWRREIHEGLRIIEAEVLTYHAESVKKPDDPMEQTVSLYLAAMAEEKVN
jgi:hypothetical protein